MINGIGIDLVEIERIKKELLKFPDRFREMIFTDTEIAYCDRSKNLEVRAQHYAGRFAAKEAFFKCIGTGWRGGIGWKDVETVNDDLGRPMLLLKNAALKKITELGAKEVHLSISHTKQHATAVVILEK